MPHFKIYWSYFHVIFLKQTIYIQIFVFKIYVKSVLTKKFSLFIVAKDLVPTRKRKKTFKI